MTKITQEVSFYLNCNMDKIEPMLGKLQRDFSSSIELKYISSNVSDTEIKITALFYSLDDKIDFDNSINQILIINNGK